MTISHHSRQSFQACGCSRRMKQSFVRATSGLKKDDPQTLTTEARAPPCGERSTPPGVMPCACSGSRRNAFPCVTLDVMPVTLPLPPLTPAPWDGRWSSRVPLNCLDQNIQGFPGRLRTKKTCSMLCSAILLSEVLGSKTGIPALNPGFR